ncbi:MAG: nucleotide exchange factor GrpE [Flavobacteriales bacterium]|nr:nucleotide exchange factor GrpE [Flavobacteriales bacterium]
MNQNDAIENEEKVANNEEAKESGAVDETNAQDAPDAGSEQEVDELTQMKEELAVWKDKFVRLHAEFDNFRKRNARERLDLIKTAGQDVILEIIPTLDDFERAMKANEQNEDIEAVKEGFSLIHNKLLRTLESKGVKPMDAMGKEFNTDHHEAITQIPAPSKKMRGKVVDVIERGYFLNDAVLRYAKVVVGQ